MLSEKFSGHRGQGVMHDRVIRTLCRPKEIIYAYMYVLCVQRVKYHTCCRFISMAANDHHIQKKMCLGKFGTVPCSDPLNN